jgi:hypothetical protein
MPEADAFFAFEALLSRLMPRYFRDNLAGVKDGCAMLEDILKQVRRKSIYFEYYCCIELKI